jgi:hypothetical protein
MSGQQVGEWVTDIVEHVAAEHIVRKSCGETAGAGDARQRRRGCGPAARPVGSDAGLRRLYLRCRLFPHGTGAGAEGAVSAMVVGCNGGRAEGLGLRERAGQGACAHGASAAAALVHASAARRWAAGGNAARVEPWLNPRATGLGSDGPRLLCMTSCAAPLSGRAERVLRAPAGPRPRRPTLPRTA